MTAVNRYLALSFVVAVGGCKKSLPALPAQIVYRIASDSLSLPGKMISSNETSQRLAALKPLQAHCTLQYNGKPIEGGTFTVVSSVPFSKIENAITCVLPSPCGAHTFPVHARLYGVPTNDHPQEFIANHMHDEHAVPLYGEVEPAQKVNIGDEASAVVWVDRGATPHEIKVGAFVLGNDRKTAVDEPTCSAAPLPITVDGKQVGTWTTENTKHKAITVITPDDDVCHVFREIGYGDMHVGAPVVWPAADHVHTFENISDGAYFLEQAPGSITASNGEHLGIAYEVDRIDCPTPK